MPEVEMAQWYVVYSKPRKEEFAKFHLQRKGVKVFLPRILLPQSTNKRKRIIPLFPNYLFVRINLFEESHYVVWSPGVKRFVSFDGTPAPLEDEFVAFLKRQESPEGIIAARSNLRAGNEVQITAGPLAGLAAIIQETTNSKGRVKVLLQLLNRQVKAEVPAHSVKSGWVV